MAKTLNSRIPEGPVAEKWTNYKAHQRLVNPKNKLKLDIIVVGTGLAALAVCHIVYAFILTAQNRRARGNQRYEVTAKPEKVEWASQHMLVLGIIIVLGLLLHLFNF